MLSAQPSSHPSRVRELKLHSQSLCENDLNLSHPSRVRELKQDHRHQ